MENKFAAPGEIAAMLKEKNIRPSAIRVRVMAYLKGNSRHPTADAIYRDLIKEMPTLSKTSIYNTLKVLSAGGVVLELNTDGKEARYDADVLRHAHFTCVSCGRIEDIRLKCADRCGGTVVKDYKIYSEQVYMTGLCGKCLKGEN